MSKKLWIIENWVVYSLPTYICVTFASSWLKKADRSLLWLAITGVFVFQILQGPHPFDDAFITFRYARNLDAGAGFVYNPGEQVQGTTTPLYTLILAAFALVFGSEKLLSISFSIALLADIANTVLLYRIARQVLNDRLLSLLLTVCFLLNPLRLVVSAGGMETSLFITLLLLMYDAYLVRRNMVMTSVWAAFSIWMRPDAVLAVIPLFVFTFWKDWKAAVRMGAISAGIFLPWLVFATVYFGSPIPHSILAKQAAYSSNYLTFTYYFLFAFLATGTQGLFPRMDVMLPGFLVSVYLAISGFLTYMRRLDPAVVLVIYPLLYYLVMLQQKAPMFFIWYYIPLMPGFLLLFWASLQNLAKKLPARLRNPSFLLAAVIFIAVPSIYTHSYPSWTTVRNIEREFRDASLGVQAQVQDGQVVYAPDIGVIGWELNNAYILDSVGLVSPQILEYYASINNIDRMNPAAIHHFRPDFIIAHDQLFNDLISDKFFIASYQLVWPLEPSGSPVWVYARKP